MPHFALVYTYTDDTDHVTAHRPAHRAYLDTLLASGELVVAGPLGAPGPAGGLLVFDVPSAERVAELADKDPFQTEGVVVERRINDWTVVFGADVFPEPR